MILNDITCIFPVFHNTYRREFFVLAVLGHKYSQCTRCLFSKSFSHLFKPSIVESHAKPITQKEEQKISQIDSDLLELLLLLPKQYPTNTLLAQFSQHFWNFELYLQCFNCFKGFQSAKFGNPTVYDHVCWLLKVLQQSITLIRGTDIFQKLLNKSGMANWPKKQYMSFPFCTISLIMVS